MSNAYFTGINSLLAPPPGVTPLPGGIGAISGLGGGPNGVLARGLGAAIPTPSVLPSMGGGLASRVPVGVGQQAFNAASALGGGVAGTAASGGGLASRLPSFITGGAAPIGRAGLLRTSVPGIVGSIGSGLIDRTNIGGQNSNIEQALQGASAGAGIGAGLGALGGPFAALTMPGGAAIGAVAGGTIGILGNMFGGGGDGEEAEQTDPIDIINRAVNAAQLDPDTQAEIYQTYSVMMAMAERYEEGSEERLAAENLALDQVGSLVLGALGARDEASSAATNTLALQAQAQDIFAPLAQDIETSGMLYAQAMNGIRDNLPAEYRAIADATTARELSSSQKLANAYRAQAAITPAISKLTQYQQDFNSYSAQQFAQALAQQASGGGASLGPSAADVQALLAPTG